MTIIGITGNMGSGKSTLASYLVDKYNYTEYAIAGPLKQIAMIFGFTAHEVYEDKTLISPKLGITAREFLQKFGTDIVRDQFKTFFPNTPLSTESQWIRLTKEFITDHKHLDIVCSDIRFEDEIGRAHV